MKHHRPKPEWAHSEDDPPHRGNSSTAAACLDLGVDERQTGRVGPSHVRTMVTEDAWRSPSTAPWLASPRHMRETQLASGVAGLEAGVEEPRSGSGDGGAAEGRPRHGGE